MIRNFIKVALRSLVKQKIYTAINVLGLAVSIAACLLIVLYVKYELSYDKFWPGGERVYKVLLERKYPNHTTFYGAMPHSYADASQRDIPEVENNLIMFGGGGPANLRYKVSDNETKAFEERFFVFADSAFTTV